MLILYSMREKVASLGRSLYLLAQAETEGSSVSQRWSMKTGFRAHTKQVSNCQVVYNLNLQIC